MNFQVQSQNSFYNHSFSSLTSTCTGGFTSGLLYHTGITIQSLACGSGGFKTSPHPLPFTFLLNPFSVGVLAGFSGRRALHHVSSSQQSPYLRSQLHLQLSWQVLPLKLNVLSHVWRNHALYLLGLEEQSQPEVINSEWKTINTAVGGYLTLSREQVNSNCIHTPEQRYNREGMWGRVSCIHMRVI